MDERTGIHFNSECLLVFGKESRDSARTRDFHMARFFGRNVTYNNNYYYFRHAV